MQCLALFLPLLQSPEHQLIVERLGADLTVRETTPLLNDTAE